MKSLLKFEFFSNYSDKSENDSEKVDEYDSPAKYQKNTDKRNRKGSDSWTKFKIRKIPTNFILRQGPRFEFMIECVPKIKLSRMSISEENLIKSPEFERKLEKLSLRNFKQKATKPDLKRLQPKPTSQSNQNSTFIEFIQQKKEKEIRAQQRKKLNNDRETSEVSSLQTFDSTKNQISFEHSQYQETKSIKNLTSNHYHFKSKIETPKKLFSRNKMLRMSNSKSPRKRSYLALKNLRTNHRNKRKPIQDQIQAKRWSNLEDVVTLGSRNFSKFTFSPSQFGRRFLQRVKGDK